MTHHGLDDPLLAAHAWGRFRTIMAGMTLLAAIVSAGAIAALAWVQGPLHLVTMLAVIGGVGGSIVMAGALMGLVFLSSGTGHDEEVERFEDRGHRGRASEHDDEARSGNPDWPSQVCTRPANPTGSRQEQREMSTGSRF